MKNNEIILWYEIASFLALFSDKITRFGCQDNEKETIFKNIFEFIGNKVKNESLWNYFSNWRSEKNFFYTRLENLLSGIEKTAISGDESDFITVFGKSIEVGNNDKKVVLKEVLDDIKVQPISEYQNIKDKFFNLAKDVVSDNRFNGSDISLWEQAFFVSSYFKSKLFEYLQNNKSIDLDNINLDLKWKILAIQYDKIGLAQKCYNLSHIKWYREVVKEIDNKLKNYFEYELAIGNELYRDESGIYFIFPNIEESSSLFKDIKKKILAIYKEKSSDEFYPYIELTNLTLTIKELSNLINKSKENFLKIDYSKKDKNLDIEQKTGICQICNVRLGNKKEDYIICDKCFENKENNRLQNWNIEDETIWLDEIKDKNNSIALISLQFGLNDWLNGKIINSLLATTNQLLMLQEEGFINQHREKIEDLFSIDNLNEVDSEKKKELAFSYLATKNPAPSRLKRVWDTTKNFFDDVYSDIDNVIDEIDKNRICLNIDKKLNDGVYRSNNLLFAYKNEKLYCVSPLREVLLFYKTNFNDIESLKDKIRELELKEEKSESKIKVLVNDVQLIKFKPFVSIIDTTPISWQFIISSNYVDRLLDLVQTKYIKEFKYVNGKLPLHIGVITQNYKFPLYVGIKALRNMRELNFKEIEVDLTYFKKDIYLKNIKDSNDTKITYFGTFWNDKDNNKKIFYNQNDSFTINNINSFSNEKLFYYPNTIDFEYLDTNSRRNDVYYENGKRVVELKQNRPYSWQEFEKFKIFRDKFKNKSNELQALVSLIYSKMQDWQNDEKSFKIFMQTTFKQRDLNIKDFAMSDFGFEEVKKFIDMFEFWHTTLKEI